ncbi:MAG TPA: endonuclease/exonuclease/phosphatase family protein [Casimicrobiaceae bacterium]|nr:endonuclease/exonuclease/phosphatase family protein [Casimicrobiaceae bacterium]
MIVITWNVQWCRGVDGTVDPARIVSEARRLADFDVLCLQEIADNFPDPELGGSAGEDQFAALAALMPNYTAIDGVAVDQPGRNGKRRRFGNMILSRLPVKQVYRHLLPYPLDPGVPAMPRIALEAVVQSRSGDVRVITTHLEYYSFNQRMAQVEALRAIYAEGHAYARDGRVTMSDGSPFQTFVRPRATIITGDCNFEPDSREYARMLEAFDDATPPLLDSWRVVHEGIAHPATFCIYQKTDPSGAELHCDFLFANDDLRERLHDIWVDQRTQASDHQPVVLTIA